MAVNPMQRKARQSFLLGMLVMLLISAIVVAILFMQIVKLKDAEQATAAASKKVSVLKSDVKSGQVITSADVTTKELVTELADAEIAKAASFTENTVAKIDIGKGTILTQSMIVEQDESVTDSLRIQEYNMLTLPSDLETNDYVDIRLLLPNGQDYIVISKKRIIQSSKDTIFLKMTEDEIVTMSNAIVETYITEGSQLYADKYVDPGIQTAAVPTYTVSGEVLNLIDKNANITTEAKNALYSRYVGERRNDINNVVSANMDDYQDKVQEGFDTQIKKVQEERSKYIETLGGTDYYTWRKLITVGGNYEKNRICRSV